MTTAVYRIPERTAVKHSNSLVCHLRSTTPAEAITTLQRSGVLAIEGPDDNSIVLVGFHPEIHRLLDYYRTGLMAYDDIHTRQLIGRLRKQQAIA